MSRNIDRRASGGVGNVITEGPAVETNPPPGRLRAAPGATEGCQIATCQASATLG